MRRCGLVLQRSDNVATRRGSDSDEDIPVKHVNHDSSHVNHKLSQETMDINHESDYVNTGRSHTQAALSHTPTMPIQGPITRSRAKKLRQKVNSFLTEYEFIKNKNFILPKCSTYVLLRFTQEGGATGPKEISHTKEKMVGTWKLNQHPTC